MAPQSRDILTVVTECLSVVANIKRQVDRLTDADRSKLADLTWELKQLAAILHLPQEKMDPNLKNLDK